jgi:Ca2+-binding EF-hand superfamily protein
MICTCMTCLTALAIAGCGRRATVAAAPVQPATKHAAEEKSTPTAVELVSSSSAPPQEPVAETVAEPATPAPPVAPTYGTERIVLIAPGNPLIVELRLTIDGRPHTEALARLVEEVLKLADADGDGQTTWRELFDCKRVKYGQFGNLAVNNENSEKQIIDRYDIARDGVADRSELPRFLTRNAGASRPFSIRGTLNYRDINRRGAATWRVIDADDDGVISADEMKLAAGRLTARDSDDDEILLIGDFNSGAAGMDGEMMEQRRRGPDAARLLGPHADWTSVQRSLEQEYGGGRGLRPDSFALTPELFGLLDKNKDGRIRRDEFEALNDVPAHLVVAVDFGKAEATGDGGQGTGDSEQETEEEAPRIMQPRLQLIHIDPRLMDGPAANGIQPPGRLTIGVGGSLLTFYTNDTVSSDNFAARAKQALEMFDQDKNGYLEASELPESLQAQLGRFEAVDIDEDRKIYAQEIESFLQQQQAGLRAQIHARAADSQDVLFAALDTDHDDRLDSRELEGAAERLVALDKNGDGQVTGDDLPEVLLIGLARGSLENADATFAPPPIFVRAAEGKAPAWFTAMDANQDGAISRREFVGPLDKFRELDRNGNGLIEWSEIADQ